MYVWDVEAVDAAGLPLVTWRGLRLADAGPIPRTMAWPPALLSVYLERGAAALGLNPELRVTVRRGQPDRGNPGAADPGAADPGAAGPDKRSGAGPDATAGVVPQPSPAPDLQPVAGSGGTPRARAARGSGHLDGFVLSVRAPGAAACGWEPAVPGPASDRDRAPGVADIEDQLRAGRGEPPVIAGAESPIIVAARLRAVAACLAMAGAPAVAPVMADAVADDDWLLLRAGGAMLACTVVEITGVPCPVAIAVMTGDTSQDGERGGQTHRRARRHRAATGATATGKA